ncbi:MAG: hypothetical protein Kow0062_06170 [Acidobacteriota bacterium]
MSGAGRIGVLVSLHAALVRARLRRALAGVGPAGELAGSGLAGVSGAALGLAGAAFFALMVRSLVATLAVHGEHELCAALAGALVPLTLALALAVALLGRPPGAAAHRRAFALLPLTRTERVAGDLARALSVDLPALVAWPGALALVVGLAAADGRAALAVAPAAGALVVLAGLAALAGRAVVGSRRLGAWRGPSLCGLFATLLAPLAPWRDGPADGGPAGLLLRLAVRSALDGRADAWLASAAMTAIAAAAVATSVVWLPERLHETETGRPRRARARRAPRLPARILRHPRARAQLAQGIATAALALAVEYALAARGIRARWLSDGVFVLAAWSAATAPAPLMANVLGLGGRAAVEPLRLAPSPGRLLATMLGALSLAGLAALAPVCAWAAFRGGTAALLLAGIAGLSALAASAGAGAIASALWPAPRRLDRLDGPVDGSGAARVIVPLAQAVAVAPAFAAVMAQGAARATLLASAAAAATLVAGTGCALGRLLVARRGARIIERLVTGPPG